MSEARVQHFIQYVELDQRIDSLTRELELLSKRRQDAEKSKKSIEDQTASAFQIVHDQQKAVDMAELELKSLGDALIVKRKKLNEAHSPKEFFSLEHEIADLVKKQEDHEVIGLDALKKLEDAQKYAAQIKAQEPDLLKAIGDQLNDIARDEAHFGPLKNALIQEKAEAEKLVDPEELERYKQMKLKVPNPVVPILKQSCTACFYLLNKQQLADASRGKLISCGDCYRLLYDPQAFMG